jgi:hypothetical protein
MLAVIANDRATGRSGGTSIQILEREELVMRRSVTLALTVALGFGLLSAAAPAGAKVPSAAVPAVADLPDWVQPADVEAGFAVTKLAPQVARRPAILLETDYYIYPYAGGDTPTVVATIDGNGYAEPVTMYLYWQNRVTHERRYISATNGLENRGVVVDLFGNSGSPLPIYAPSFADLVLLGDDGAFGSGPDNPTGLYEFVLELRDASGETVISSDNAMYNHIDNVVTVSGSITEDTVWTANNAYLLNSAPVYVGGNPITGSPAPTPTNLYIEPGTVILGDTDNQGTLVVIQDSKVFATGTPSLPIIFSSVQPLGSRGAGDWGGIVLNGRAPVNDPTIPTNPDAGEGASGPFGGDNPNDSSGVLQYVRVEFAGIRFSDTNELNGIALQGVGSGTVVDHIEVAFNQDDGIEFFGGTVNASYVFIYGARDDSIDCTLGWTGRLDNAVAIQRGDDGDNGFEWDNWEFGFDFSPRSQPKVANVTLIGLKDVPGVENGSGGRLRAGTAGLITGAIWYNFGRSGLRIQTPESMTQIQQGNLNIANSIIYGVDPAYEGDDEQIIGDMLESAANGNIFADAMLADPLNPVKPDITPLPGSPAIKAGNAGTLDYIGGVDPNAPWIYEGWISYSDN